MELVHYGFLTRADIGYNIQENGRKTNFMYALMAIFSMHLSCLLHLSVFCIHTAGKGDSLRC